MAINTISSLTGNKNITLLHRLMDMSTQQKRVHDQNIAHVNTPNYRRRSFNFHSSLKEAMREGTPEAYHNIRGWIERPRNTPVRNNGNNVDIDQEMLQMQENSKFYESLIMIQNKQSKLFSIALQGGR